MNGIMIVLMIAELIFAIGLGLAIATIHSVLVRFMAAQNRLTKLATDDRKEIRKKVEEIEKEQARMNRSI